MTRTIKQVLQSIKSTDISGKRKTNLSREPLNDKIKEHLEKVRK